MQPQPAPSPVPSRDGRRPVGHPQGFQQGPLPPPRRAVTWEGGDGSPGLPRTVDRCAPLRPRAASQPASTPVIDGCPAAPPLGPFIALKCEALTTGCSGA